jgi:hypothetical protein
MITVAMMFKDAPQRKDGVYMSMLYMAPAFGINLFMYSVSDVDFENKTINGKFFENGKVVRRVVPIPPLTDNRLIIGIANREFYKQMAPLSYCPRNKLGINKFQQNELYLKHPDPRFADWAIPSVKTSTVEELLASFDSLKTDEIIMKSAGGNQGKGIIKIERHEGLYVASEDGFIEEIPAREFAERFADRVPRMGFAQPCINSRAVSEVGAPFDIRIKVQRRNATKYSVTMYPRINASKGAITSNIHQGGFTIPLETFLLREYGSQSGEIREVLDAFGKTFPTYFQKFLKRPFFDLGIDIGIDRRPDGSFQPVIFEVNYLPGGSGYLGERTGVDNIIATFEYYHYLWNKFIDSTHPSYIGLTDSYRTVK